MAVNVSKKADKREHGCFQTRAATGIQLGFHRGMEKGRQEGEREAALKIARITLANGLDRDSVMKMTGLTADNLAQIRH